MKIMPVYLPIEKNVISREHIELAAERDERIEAFVTRLRDDFEVGLSFSDNLKKFFLKNKTKKEIENLVWEAAEEEV